MKVYNIEEYIQLGRKFEDGLKIRDQKQEILPMKIEENYDKKFIKTILGLDVGELLKREAASPSTIITDGIRYGALKNEATITKDIGPFKEGDIVRLKIRIDDVVMIEDKYHLRRVLPYLVLKPGLTIEEKVKDALGELQLPNFIGRGPLSRPEEWYYYKRNMMIRAAKLILANNIGLKIIDEFSDVLMKVNVKFAKDWIMSSIDPEHTITYEEAVTLLFAGKSVKCGDEVFSQERIKELRYQELYEAVGY